MRQFGALLHFLFLIFIALPAFGSDTSQKITLADRSIRMGVHVNKGPGSKIAVFLNGDLIVDIDKSFSGTKGDNLHGWLLQGVNKLEVRGSEEEASKWMMTPSVVVWTSDKPPTDIPIKVPVTLAKGELPLILSLEIIVPDSSEKFAFENAPPIHLTDDVKAELTAKTLEIGSAFSNRDVKKIIQLFEISFRETPAPPHPKGKKVDVAEMLSAQLQGLTIAPIDPKQFVFTLVAGGKAVKIDLKGFEHPISFRRPGSDRITGGVQIYLSKVNGSWQAIRTNL